MLYKWNRIVCDLLGLAFFTWHNSLKIHPGCYVIPFYCPVVIFGIDVLQFAYLPFSRESLPFYMTSKKYTSDSVSLHPCNI